MYAQMYVYVWDSIVEFGWTAIFRDMWFSEEYYQILFNTVV